MQRVGKFEKVSGFKYDVELPVRATKGSAGYDIKTPVDIKLNPGESIMVETGLRVKIKEGWMLMIVPKSGLGAKFRCQLNNTTGIIDSDYYYAENQGHIMCPIINDSRDGKVLEIPAGKAFVQAIFVPYGITEDDVCDGERTGGFGSTNA